VGAGSKSKTIMSRWRKSSRRRFRSFEHCKISVIEPRLSALSSSASSSPSFLRLASTCAFFWLSRLPDGRATSGRPAGTVSENLFLENYNLQNSQPVAVPIVM
jgi:hypothetical protein